MFINILYDVIAEVKALLFMLRQTDIHLKDIKTIFIAVVDIDIINLYAIDIFIDDF